MNNNNNKGGRQIGRRSGARDDEVEQLLRGAQDELLLKLSVNSHMSRVSPDYLLPDLDRRFQALKSRPTATPPKPPNLSSTPTPNPQPPTTVTDDDKDDLFARFAALKAASSSSSNSTTVLGRDCGGDSDDEEDEVEKIIRWAKDAACLDPSPPSDDNDTTDGEDDELDTVGKRK